MGTYGQSVTLANSIIGVGILAMPFCFHQCGVILATLMLLCSGLVSRLTCHFLLKSAIMSRRRNFEFLAFHVFGSAGKFAVEIGIIGFLMGTCIAYFVVVGDLGPQIIAKMFNINQSDVLRSSVMVMVSVVCVLPLGLLRNVDSLGNVSAATIGFYMCLVLKIIGEATSQIFAGDWLTKVDLWKPEGLLQCVPIFSMALFCQTQLFEIFEPLPNISLDKMNVVTKNAINICTSVYILVGLFGYIAFSGQPISGNILVNMSATMASDVIKIGFVMSLAFSFPLIIFPCRASLYSLLYRRGHTPHYEALNHPIPMYRFRTLTVAIVCTTLLVSLAVPNVALVLGLLGSTVGVAVCVIFPATCFICISFKNTNERILAQVIWCFGIIMMVLGTYANLQAAESQLNMHLSADIPHIPKLMENVDKEINGDSLSIPEILQKKEKSIADESESLIQPPNPVPPMADKVRESAKIDSIHNADIALPANSDDSFVQPPVLPDLDSEVQPKNPVPPDSDSEVQPKNPVAPDSDSEVQPKNPVAPDSEVQPINPVAPDIDLENHLQNAVAPIIETEVLRSNDKAPILATDEQKKLDSSNSDPKTIPVAQNLNTIIESQKIVLTDNVETKEVRKTKDIMVPRVVMGDNQENILTDLPPQTVVGSNRTNILKSIKQSGEPIKENVDTIVQHAIANEEKLDKIKQETLIETMKKQGEEQKEILQEQKKILKEIQESLQIKKKDENNSQNPEETKKQAVESIQKIAELAIKRLEKISSRATTAGKKSDGQNKQAPSDKEQSNSPQEGSLSEHIHKPDEPESYIRGEDSEKAKMSAANMKAIVDKVPIPIALRNTQQEAEQVKNSGEPKSDNEPEFHTNGANIVLNKSKMPRIEDEKIVQGNISEDDVLLREHHFIQKREIVDCTLTSNISEDDKRICETIMSSKDNSKGGIDVELPQLSVPDVNSVLAELKNSDSLNSVMLNNIDLVHFKSRNLKTTDDETNPG